MKQLNEIPTLGQRFYINRQLILKSFDLIVISCYIFFIQTKQDMHVSPLAGNWFISNSTRDLSVAYITLAVALFGIFVSLNKHNMVQAKKYTYLAILLSWSTYGALFWYKAFYLGGSWIAVVLIVLIIVSILMELFVGDWDGDKDL